MDLRGHRLLPLLALLLAACAAVSGETIFVNRVEDDVVDDSLCTLREAVLTANGAPANDDCMEEGAPGTNVIVLPPDVIYITDGEMEITDDLVIEGELSSAVDGLGQSEIFRISSGSVRFRDLEIRQGFTDSSQRGGAISNTGGEPLYIENVQLRNNRGVFTGTEPFAGAVYSNGLVFASDSTFTGNSAVSDTVSGSGPAGAAIFGDTTVVVERCTFTNNVARNEELAAAPPSTTPAPQFAAGGIAVVSSSASAMISATDCTFDRNDGVAGGAILMVADDLSGPISATVQARGCSFTNNEANSDGGAVFSNGPVLLDGAGTASLRRNAASAAGGVVLSTDTVDVENFAEISGNTAAFGGAFYAESNVRVRGITALLDNTATEGPGGVAVSSGGFVDIHDVAGDISGNSAEGAGGVAFSPRGVDIRRVGGSVRSNNAEFGGVAYTYGAFNLEAVTGTVSDNYAAYNGGVAYAASSARLYSTGVLRGNTAGGIGGALHSFTVDVEAVGGIVGNTVEGQGGAFAGVVVQVRDVRGDISNNKASIGGVIAVGDRGGGGYQESIRAVIDGVSGSIRSNEAGYTGGVVLSFIDSYISFISGVPQQQVLITNVSGDISYNVVGREDRFRFLLNSGGVVAAAGGVVIRNIGGNVSHNQVFHDPQLAFANYFAYSEYGPQGGGVARCGGAYGASCILENVTGSVNNNEAAFGGVLLSVTKHTTLRNIGGSLNGNSAAHFGGVVAALNGGVLLSDVNGTISNNVVGASLGSFYPAAGGVVAALNGVQIVRVGGAISGNRADYPSFGGVVASGNGDVLIDSIVSLRNNRAEYGGVAHAPYGRVVISNVTESIAANVALIDGGVAYGRDVDMHNIGGNIAFNIGCVSDSSNPGGGVIFSVQSASIRNVGGSINSNKCLPEAGGGTYFAEGQGGVIQSINGPVSIGQVAGDITQNSANLGGVLSTRLGSVDVFDIGGSISLNRAEYAGGVAHVGNSEIGFSGFPNRRDVEGFPNRYSNSVHITNVVGSISGNTCAAEYQGGGVVFSPYGSVFIQGVGGDVSDNSGYHGGVVYGWIATLSDVSGNVSNNSAHEGGVFYLEGEVAKIENVGGDIAQNEALYAGAVVAMTDFDDVDVLLSNIGGSIRANRACAGGYDFDASKRRSVEGGVLIDNLGGGVISISENGAFDEFFGRSVEQKRNHSQAAVRIVGVGGDISDNTALGYGCYGGVVYSSGSALIENVGGSIERNAAAESGGVIYAQTDALVINVGGSIRYNYSSFCGGVVCAIGTGLIRSVIGDISYNYANPEGFSQGTFTRDVRGLPDPTVIPCGGVICADDQAEITVVSGNVEHNSAFHGGVLGVTSTDGAVHLTAVGRVRYNSANGYGGAVYSRGRIIVDYVAGDLSHNSAGAGGFAYSSSYAQVTNVFGSISYNETSEGPGGFIWSDDGLVIRNVYGDVTYNKTAARYGVLADDRISYFGYLIGHGGVAFANGGSVHISNVTGAMCYNSAVGGGGVAFGDASVTVSGVGGDVCQNTARSGGVAWSETQDVLFQDIGGSVRGNSATEWGGVLGSSHGARLVRVAGSVTANTAGYGGVLYAGEAYSGQTDRVAGVLLEQIGGDVSNNRGDEYGGVLYAQQSSNLNGSSSEYGIFAVMGRVGGAVYGNTSRYGAVISVYDGHANVHDVEGAVRDNIAYYGGVVYARNGSVNVHDTGAILRNFAQNYGGVVYVDPDTRPVSLALTVSRVNGDISYNRAKYGGFVYLDDGSDVRVDFSFVNGSISYNTADVGGLLYDDGTNAVLALRHITGSIHHNSANSGSGGVAYVDTFVMVDVGGDVSYNTASDYGGVVYAQYGAEFSNVKGSISHNSARGGAGVAYIRNNNFSDSFVPLVFRDTGGDISHNSSNSYGGIAYVSSGGVEVSRTGGSMVGNTATFGGGGFWVDDGNALIDYVGGSISDNTAGRYDGGFLALDGGGSDSHAIVRNVYGDIARNTALAGRGGFVYVAANVPLVVRNVRGSIVGNVAGEDGGVLYSDGPAVLIGVDGDVSSNRATGGDGGVIFANYSGLLQNVTGSVSGNTAARRGGVVYCNDTVSEVTCAIIGVGGSIENNRALAEDGGVVFAVQAAAIVDVVGHVIGNRARYGGVVYSEHAVEMRKITGDVSRNIAGASGGVIYGYGDGAVGERIEISDIGGSIAENASGDFGGVVYQYYGNVEIARVRGSIRENSANDSGGVALVYEGSAIVHDIAGSILSNEAFGGDGGVIDAFYRVEISDVFGRICGNSAYVNGGVAYSRYGDILIFTEGTGAVQDNTAGESGGVAYAYGSIRVDADEGIVHNNLPQVAVSRNGEFVEVLASLDTQSGLPTISIVTQPVGGVEREPLVVQPELDIAGAVDGKEVPIDVTLVLGSGEEIPLPGPWNVDFGDTQQYLDLEVPVFGRNMTLRFSFAVSGCTHDDTEELVSVTSDPFNVTECAYPHPVVCPSDVTVPSELHECSSYVDIPLPSVARCSAPFISHDAMGAQLPSIASGNYPVGTTVVQYEAENSDAVSDECLLYVTVVDAQEPRLVCPDDIVVSNDAGQCGAIVDVPLPTVTDNCAVADVALRSDHPDPFFTVGVTSVTWEGVDQGGNSDSCTLTVTVIDDELPVIECPGDLVVACGSPPTFQAVSGTDNCPSAVTTQTNGPPLGSLTPLPSGATTFSFAVQDAVGQRASCSWTVTTQSTWYVDADGDGVGARGSTPRVQCPAPGPNWVQDRNTDCDDTNPELGLIVYPDADRDTYGNPELLVCVAYDFFSNPSKRDVAHVAADLATDNLIVRAGDCDDTNRLVNPGMQEVCGNGIDDNCDGQIDENCPPEEDTSTVPTVPMPAVPLAPVPSVPTPIIIPTPLPQPPPSPSVVEPIIIPEYTFSAASSAPVACLALLALSLFLSYLM